MAQCACGCWHSLFLDPYGTVWSCGNNQDGELGLGHNTMISSPQRTVSGAAFCLFVDANASVWSCGYNGHGIGRRER